MRQIVQNYRTAKRSLLLPFGDLEKAPYLAPRSKLWNALRPHGVGLWAHQDSVGHVSRCCDQGVERTTWSTISSFSVIVGVHQGLCLQSIPIFLFHMSNKLIVTTCSLVILSELLIL